jgi:dihydroxyacid dehydratase/phosphogluconate dehydratase
LERWNQGDNGILDLSKAYRLKPGTGWLVPPCILHAPGSLVTYEPQWGSDVFGMYQSMVEGRYVPWNLLVKDVPTAKHQDLDYLVHQLDWEANVNAQFKDSHYLEPIPAADSASSGFVDRWVVYGKVKGKQLFTAKELTVNPGARCTVKDGGAYGLIAMQGRGRIGKTTLHSPSMIRYGELTEDEVFVSAAAAGAGVEYENLGKEPLVVLRYFGPDAQPNAPEVGAHKK